MTYQTSATPDYTLGFSEEVLVSPRRHRVERDSAYMLPYLRPGLRVLDFGCGPGTISVGMAKYIDPGELHGVDMQASQVELARNAAKASGRSNAIFHVADVTDLPFEDGFFDVAHGHNILMHVPDTGAALAEVKRVLKPGGILSCREMITSSCFAHPNLGMTQRLWEMFEDLIASNDGHPDMGKDMKIHIHDAGFTNIRMSASFNTYSSPEELSAIYSMAMGWLLSSETEGTAILYGAWTEELSNRMKTVADNWMNHPGAFAATAYGEAVANKP